MYNMMCFKILGFIFPTVPDRYWFPFSAVVYENQLFSFWHMLKLLLKDVYSAQELMQTNGGLEQE